MSAVDRRAKERGETRVRILSAARDLFVRHGFEAVTMRQIADAVEYTAAALYVHFTNKHELIAALCQADFGLLREAERSAEGIADPVERLGALGRGYVEFALEHPHHYRFMFMTPPPAMSEAQAKRMGCGNPEVDGYEVLRRAVAECLAKGRMRAELRDVEEVTMMCWGAAHGVVSLFLTFRDDPWVKFGDAKATAFALLDASVRGMLREGAGVGGRA